METTNIEPIDSASARAQPPSNATPATRDQTLDREAIFALDRPDRRLLTYYIVLSCCFLVLMPLVLLFFYLRYRTLRYRFDEEGISMRWGALRRQEVNLSYARIQDIHLTSNAFERWLGLARIQVQTASGSQKAEVTIEGIRDFTMLRSFLVERMRRARGQEHSALSPASVALPVSPQGHAIDDATLRAVTENLDAVATSLREIRQALQPIDSDDDARSSARTLNARPSGSDR